MTPSRPKAARAGVGRPRTRHPQDPYWDAGTEPELITVPELPFIAVDGHGDPETSAGFQHAIEALYGIAYGIKMSPRSGEAPASYEDFRIGPLEGLWWIEGKAGFDLASPGVQRARERWRWTLMIRQPAFVDASVTEAFRERLKAKKPSNPAVADVRFERFAEGECVQCMHIGPYATEAETLAKIERFAATGRKRLVGRHHEIYLGDPRRARPERLRTILRHPVS